MNLIKMLSDFSFLTALLPLVAAHIRFKHIKRHIVPIYLLVFTSVFLECINFMFSKFGENNLYLFRLFTIIEFFLISFFYSEYLKKFTSPKTIYGILPIFLFIAFIDYRIYGLEALDSLSISVESIILTCYSLFLFYYFMKHLIVKNLLESSVFWINCGVLIYFLGNFFLFTFNNYVLNLDTKKHFLLWGTVHASLNIVYNILLSIGFWKTKTK
jgi:hypothetical protein